MFGVIDRCINKVYQTGTDFQKLVFCSTPLINSLMMNIASNEFNEHLKKSNLSLINLKQQEKRKFEAIFLKGAVNQAIVATALFAAVILFHPVILPGMFLHIGLAAGGLLYTGSSLSAFLRYQHERNFVFEVVK